MEQANNTEEGDTSVIRCWQVVLMVVPYFRQQSDYLLTMVMQAAALHWTLLANVKTLFSTIHQQKGRDGYFQFCLPTNLNCFCVTSINKPSQHRSILYYVHFIDTKTQMKVSLNINQSLCVACVQDHHYTWPPLQSVIPPHGHQPPASIQSKCQHFNF